MAERYLKARILANRPAYESWLATAFWCTQLAKVRATSDPSMIEDEKDGKKRRLRVHLFERIRAPQICKGTTLSKYAIEAAELVERARGEPLETLTTEEGQNAGEASTSKLKS